ncbi:HK97-gp10 family putative phage morphogenesis protein [Lentilactobacillus kosonis]|uniref:Phage tail assembly n=1 Tax=Lentilactobacillus kosonis TaxID=2810561 RepID=A0A401FPN0_9LACO|nr:HK97-gp10 family putative phage morphogenesis protein [Lentilactobacillus kosonis]GAY74349.1 phage tail assembly [Lentilactobacillus kosonis]
MELDKALDNWLANIIQAQHFTNAEKAHITGAGAKVLSKHLEDMTKQKHYRVHIKGKTDTHLSDAVTYRKTDIDGARTGVSTVGFTPEKAYIARFLNDGTKYIAADHFVDNAREEAKSEVIAAETEVYQQTLHKKWGDN